MSGRVGVVVGATGVIGGNFARYLASQDGWQVVGLCRRPPQAGPPEVRYVPVDLLDSDAASGALSGLSDATHVFYAGFIDAPSQAEQVAPNLAMLVNAVEGIEQAADGLQRVVLVEGNKWYGSHLGPFPTPAKETDPRCMGPMFYHDQQDWLVARQQGKAWTWSALRPQTVCGFAVGFPMNLITVIGMWAALSKERGLPLDFPGKPGAYRAIYQVTDAAHLAKAMLWAGTAETAANEAFNIINGDYFRWERVWGRIAEAFEMPRGVVRTINLTQQMADKAPEWDAIVQKYGLQPNAYEALAAWPFADYCLGCDYDVMSDTTKIRKAGFHDVVESEAMFFDIFRQLRADKIFP